MDELVGHFLDTVRFELPVARTVRWWGFAPGRRWRMLPVYLSRVFPAGIYEIGLDDDAARWRYCGPHFSVHGTHIMRGNQMIPVGFVGDYAFGGQWNPGGRTLKPGDLSIDMTPEWAAHHANYLAAEHAQYVRAAHNVREGNLGAALRWMLYSHAVR